MPYTAITKPTQGTATKKSIIDALIDNDVFFNAAIAALEFVDVLNGSFENTTAGVPDEWTFTNYNGGSGAIDTSASHGLNSYKITSPGGGGNGGGYLTSNTFFAVSPLRPLILSWQQISSVAGIHNLVEVRWYDSAQSFISSSTLYDDDTTNPTSWTLQSGAATPPSNARFAKLRITGAKDDNTTAGSVKWDDFKLGATPTQGIETLTGSGNWVCPANVLKIKVRAWGGGGGGAGTSSFGGGGGEYAEEVVSVTPSASYPFAVGAGGTGAGDGGDTTFDTSTVVANGGTGGGTTGSGGTGSSNSVHFDGQDGGVAANGGASVAGGSGGIRPGSVGPTPSPATVPGGGGATPSSGGSGGDGAAGSLIIEYIG
jgi:hypothetical protein